MCMWVINKILRRCGLSNFSATIVDLHPRCARTSFVNIKLMTILSIWKGHSLSRSTSSFSIDCGGVLPESNSLLCAMFSNYWSVVLLCLNLATELMAKPMSSERQSPRIQERDSTSSGLDVSETICGDIMDFANDCKHIEIFQKTKAQMAN